MIMISLLLLQAKSASLGVSDGKYTAFYKQRFGDIKIKWNTTFENPSDLLKFINLHINQWKLENRPSVWVKLHGKDLDHLSALINNGFQIHRVKPNNVIVLNKWILDRESTLPSGPFAYLGVGGLCVNNEGKILAVRENYASGPSAWKLPGGMFDPEKDVKLEDTVVREIFEETGIKAEPLFLLSQRFLRKGYAFNFPDLYSIYKLKPITTNITYDPVEIYQAEWVEPHVLYGSGEHIKRAIEKLDEL